MKPRWMTPPSLSRRDFVRAGAITTLVSATPRILWGRQQTPATSGPGRTGEASHLLDPHFVQSLVLAAIDAARSSGAKYADARVTRTVSEGFFGPKLTDDFESLCIGVRVLVDGAWGFAASPYWEIDEAVSLARDAVAQAKINAAIFPRTIELGSYPRVEGVWNQPIKIDPFQISVEEKIDFVDSFDTIFPRHRRGRRITGGMVKMGFSRQERTVATSEGSLFSQTLYQSWGEFSVAVNVFPVEKGVNGVSTGGRNITLAGSGWERILDAGLREQIPELIEEAESYLYIAHKPVEVGRYDLVVPAPIMAQFISSSLGDATQLDRALGYEANAGGTSFLGPDPMSHLGTTLGSRLLSVQGDRSLPTGLATVQWDDEGVVPETFPIIQEGRFVDYQTTREQAPWLSSWYERQQRPVRSHGCSVAPEADNIPMQHTPNLLMQSGEASIGFDDMIQNTKRGIAFLRGMAGTDWQSRTGYGGGIMREIVDGKLGAVLDGAELLFDSSQLWKKLIAIGGEDSREILPASGGKGEPSRKSLYSVAAVPGHFKDMTIIDGTRKS